jgi:signal recognition particle receptor subunit beta
MPVDYTGQQGFMYSIVQERDSSMNTEVKIIVIGEKGSGKNQIIEKFFEEGGTRTDGSTDERFKYL